MSLPYKKNFIVSQTFLNPNSVYESGVHLGVDLVGLEDKTIYAIKNGTVFSAQYDSGFGNSVVVKQQDNYYTRYSHLETLKLKSTKPFYEGSTVVLELRVRPICLRSDPTPEIWISAYQKSLTIRTQSVFILIPAYILASKIKLNL
jgi:hypothetical protein